MHVDYMLEKEMYPFPEVTRSVSDTLTRKDRDFVRGLIQARATTGEHLSTSTLGEEHYYEPMKSVFEDSASTLNGGSPLFTWPALSWDSCNAPAPASQFPGHQIPTLSIDDYSQPPTTRCADCAYDKETAYCWACGRCAAPAREEDNNNDVPFFTRAPNPAASELLAYSPAETLCASFPPLLTIQRSQSTPALITSRPAKKRVRFATEYEECETYSKADYARGYSLSEQRDMRDDIAKAISAIQRFGSDLLAFESGSDISEDEDDGRVVGRAGSAPANLGSLDLNAKGSLPNLKDFW